MPIILNNKEEEKTKQIEKLDILIELQKEYQNTFEDTFQKMKKFVQLIFNTKQFFTFVNKKYRAPNYYNSTLTELKYNLFNLEENYKYSSYQSFNLQALYPAFDFVEKEISEIRRNLTIIEQDKDKKLIFDKIVEIYNWFEENTGMITVGYRNIYENLIDNLLDVKKEMRELFNLLDTIIKFASKESNGKSYLSVPIAPLGMSKEMENEIRKSADDSLMKMKSLAIKIKQKIKNLYKHPLIENKFVKLGE